MIVESFEGGNKKKKERLFKGLKEEQKKERKKDGERVKRNETKGKKDSERLEREKKERKKEKKDCAIV